MEYLHFKNWQEMWAYANGKVKTIEPIEVVPEEVEKPKKPRKKKGESDGGDVQAD